MPAPGSDRDRADPLAGLSIERPRLMLTPARVAELRLMIANDRFAARLADDVRAQADALRAKPLPPYPTPPANSPVVAREYLDRVLTG